MGMSSAIAMRVGNLIGAMEPAQAKRSAAVATTATIAVMGAVSLLILAGRDVCVHFWL